MKEFIKVYDSFWTSTLSLEDPATRLVFMAMIHLADSQGRVHRSPVALSRFTNISPEGVGKAISILSAPDPGSTSVEEEGRRILDLGGNHWKVVNYERYMAKSFDRKDYMKHYMRDYRSKDVKPVSSSVKDVSIEEERRGEEIREEKTPPKSPSRGTKPVEYPADFEEFWAIYPRPVGKRKALQRWQETKADRPSNGELLEALRMRVAAWRNMDTPPDKIPHPATWLNQHRWLDEPMRMNV